MQPLFVQTPLHYLSGVLPVQHPRHPNRSRNSYAAVKLKYYHNKVSACYGCSGKLKEHDYPAPVPNMIIVSKTQ